MSETAYYAGQFSLQGSMQTLRETADLHKQRADLAEQQLTDLKRDIRKIVNGLKFIATGDPDLDFARRAVTNMAALEAIATLVGGRVKHEAINMNVGQMR